MNTIEKALAAAKKPMAKTSADTTYTPVERSDGAAKRSNKSAAHTPVTREPPSGSLHPLIDIPFEALQERGYLTPALPRSTTAEEFRAIKRPLLNNLTTRSRTAVDHANLIMVTSALEGDGKTFSSLNLAMSIALEQDKTVLFIDADVRKATAGTLLGIPADTPGLIDLLSDDAVEPQDVILRTSMPNLRVLAAGSPHEHATELLASEDMRRLMLEFSERYSDRIIVFDSPPLLLTNESSVLASFMGQIVFVVAANYTPQHAVKQGLEKISEDKMVGMMLNKAYRHHFNLLGLSSAYGYGYGYGYGSREREAVNAAGESCR